MNPEEFLEAIKSELGGDICQELPSGKALFDERGLPHININYRNITFKIDFVIKEELALIAYVRPPGYLTIRTWNLFERIISWLPFMAPVKFPITGEERFFLRGTTDEAAKEYFTRARSEKILGLYPFVEIEQKERTYRCLKYYNSEYNLQQFLKDLDLFADYIELTRPTPPELPASP